jgi:hypothetical protein
VRVAQGVRTARRSESSKRVTSESKCNKRIGDSEKGPRHSGFQRNLTASAFSFSCMRTQPVCRHYNTKVGDDANLIKLAAAATSSMLQHSHKGFSTTLQML